MTRILRLVSFTFLITLLVACSPATPLPLVAATASPLPSATQSIPTPSNIPPTSTSAPAAPVAKNLLIAYIFEDSVNIRQAGGPSVQLTQGDRDRRPTLSTDGEKIVFLRKFLPHELYSINTDGSGERELVSGQILNAYSSEYSELTELLSFSLIPDTHLVIFNTRELNETILQQQDWQRLDSRNNNDLLVVNADTGEIKTLLPHGQGGKFVISPDGTLIAVQTRGHVHVIGLDGSMIRQSLVRYLPTSPYELDPDIFWTADSSELIVTLPVDPQYNMDGPETRAVWRYPINGGARAQVPLKPSPLASDYSISPDGNWILYTNYYYPGKTDESIPAGLYLGNLQDGTTQLYSPDVVVPAWSLDSKHFGYDGIFIGEVGLQPVSLGQGTFLGWADASHYLYFTDHLILGEIDGEPVDVLDVPAVFGVGADFFAFLYLNDRSANK